MFDITHTPSFDVDSADSALVNRLAEANAGHEQVVLTAKGTPLGIFIPMSDAMYLDSLDDAIYAESKAEIARGDYVTLDQMLHQHS